MVERILKSLNTLRTNPISLQKDLLTRAKALKRVKKTKVATELENFVNGFNDFQPLGELVFSEGLTKACQEEIQHSLKGEKKVAHRGYNDVKGHVEKYVSGFTKLSMMLDKGDAESMISRMLVSDYDPNRENRDSLFDQGFKYVGIATKEVEDDDFVSVIILADFAEELDAEEAYTFAYPNLTDLEKAFDLFDVNRTGKLDPKELKQSLRALGYDLKNPTLFDIIDKLDTKENEKNGVDFRTFAIAFDQTLGNDRTKDGLFKLFTLFIDDPHQYVINEASIRKLCLSVDERLNEGEAKDILDRASLSGNELTFDEFYDIMTSHVSS